MTLPLMLTEKQNWFFQELAADYNPVRAARKVGMGTIEYERITSDPDFTPYFQAAQTQYQRAISADDGKPAPFEVPETVTREWVNAQLVQLLDDLAAERITPQQATAGKGLLETLAKTNGLITQDINVNVRRSIDTMSTAELERVVAERASPGRIIDLSPVPTDGDGNR